jgi:carbamoyl-phosphate synthase large subunit
MIRILVAGDGGAPTLNFVRSLRRMTEKPYIIGMGAHPFDLCKSECDETHLVPWANEPDYLPVVQDLVRRTKPDFFHQQNDKEIAVVSELREQLGVKTFLPSKETVATCVNKWASYEKWAAAGLKVPRTVLLRDPAQLVQVMKELGPKVWLRAWEGGFGFGAVPTDDPEFARIWIDTYKGWGSFTAAECLSPDSVTWTSIWKDGKLVVAQSRKRLYWEFGNRNLSGVTGITGTGVTVSDPVVDAIALKAVQAIDRAPQGIFSVDLTYDAQGVPNPTEINIARFFTTHEFFAAAGLNVAEIYLRCALDLPLPKIEPKINPLPAGLAWVRGMDSVPVLTTLEAIEARKQGLQALRQSLGKGAGR